MSCITFRVARKYHPQVYANGMMEAAVMNVRPAMFPPSIIGVPPRAKRVQVPRRRLYVVGAVETPMPVKIVHAVQNLDALLVEPLLPQSPRI